MERYWFILSIISIGTGGFFAFLVAMSRTPFGHSIFPEDYFYHALVGHVDLAIVMWLMSFTLLLWTKLFREVMYEKALLFMAYIGYVLIALSCFFALGEPIPNNYVPVIVHPLFFLGIGLFILSFSFKTFLYLSKALRGVFSPDPLINCASAGIFVSLLMIASYMFSFFKAGSPSEPLLYFERFFWIPGHIQQFLNGLLLLMAWYYLILLEGKRVELNFLRYINTVFIIFSLLTFSLLFIYEDPISKDAKLWAEISYGIGLGIPIFVHTLNLLKNFRPSFSIFSVSLIFSFTLYYLGILIAYLGLSNDLRVPAHYHGAVTSITIALMAISYNLIKEYGYRRVIGKIPKVQPYFYGIGMILFVLSLYWAGKGGAPRKTYGVDFTDNPSVIISLTLMGIGTILAVLGGIMFVVYMLSSLISRERVGINEKAG